MTSPTAARNASQWPAIAVISISALVLTGFAIGSDVLRDTEGGWTSGVVLPLAMVVAIIATLLLAKHAPRSAGWGGLMILSWGAALALIDAPPAVAYQHVRIDAGNVVHAVALAIVAAQAIMLVLAGRDHVRALWSWCRAHVRPWVVILALVIIVLPAAVPSANPTGYVLETLWASGLQLMAIATLVAAARTAPETAWTTVSRTVTRILGAEDMPGPQRIDSWILKVAAGVFTIAALLAWFVYEAHPHVPDEVIYLVHARYLAEGMLTMPLPPVPEAFNLDLMHYEPTRWFSPVPPGWPMVLAIGAWAGLPWLVNPVLGAIAVMLTYLVMGRLTSAREARLATLLLAASPWFLFMTMNFMTHMVTLVFALAAAYGVAVARGNGSWIATLLAGFAVGATALVRPLEGLITALLLGFWSLKARGRVWRLAPSAALVVGTLATGLLDRPYNALLTGSSSEFPIMAYINKYYTPGSNDLGFGANRGLGWSGLDPFPGHGAPDVVVNAALNTAQWNVELLGWPIGAVLLVTIVLLAGRPHLARKDWWFIAAILAVIGAHSFYWFSGGPDFGARYWFLIIVPCCVLVARGLGTLDAMLTPVAHRIPARSIALALIPAALLIYVPWRAVGKYHHYRNMRADVRQLAREHGFGTSLVLVRGERHPDYASAATYNPIDLRAEAPIFAWDASAKIRSDVLDAYPDRTVWIVDGPTITGNGFRVVAGPMTAEEARQNSIPPYEARYAYDPVNPPRRGQQPD